MIEQQERRIEALEAEIAKIRETASIDIQNAQNDVVAKNREIGRLRAELVKSLEEEPDNDDVRTLLLLWKQETGRNAKCDIGAGSKRHKLAKAAIKRWGVERSTNAIRGLALKPYSGPRGRSHEPYLGATKHADVEHALGDETRMERCEQYWLEHLTPTLESPVEPVPSESRPAEPETEYDPAPGLLLITPTKGRPAGYHDGGWRGDTTPPSTKVIAALHDRGCTVKPNPTNLDRWVAQCPAHEDRDPSLSIERKPDGTLLVHCFAGCDIGDIMAALNLDVRELWAGAERDYDRTDGVRPTKVVPPHLRQAMRHLLDLDAREAA